MYKASSKVIKFDHNKSEDSSIITCIVSAKSELFTSQI